MHYKFFLTFSLPLIMFMFMFSGKLLLLGLLSALGGPLAPQKKLQQDPNYSKMDIAMAIATDMGIAMFYL